MNARTAGRRRPEEPVDYDDPFDEDSSEGLVGRLLARVMENPALSAGVFVLGLTTVAVISNAVFLQSTQHPEPWFGTRATLAGGTPAAPQPMAVPDPRPRAEAAVVATESIASAGQSDLPAVPGSQPRAPSTPTLVADLQRALSERGLYQGKVDGIYGSQTRAAISAYEKAQGLPVTGEPSGIVLDHMATASIARPTANADIPATPVKTVSIDVPAVPAASDNGVAEAQEILSYPPRAETVSATVQEAATQPAATRVDLGAQRTLAVQKALNQIGYGPVPEDGIAGEATVSAIRRFEGDNALPVTGAAGDTLIERLVAIGAMKAA